ncbi:AraC family transcriptional regulator [Flavobacterium rhizosphaerae]|uniref:AraC family transcriptional regulator n=1 Tax=Flavobacterium rhizosphaerae TaxID=3163298 RepID=A0ABW8YWG1_9FLAO
MKAIKTAAYEVVEPSFGSSFSYSQFRPGMNLKAHLWHYHPEIELAFINGGSGKRQIGSHVSYYTDGDLILIGSNLPHCGFTDVSTGNSNEVIIQIKPGFMGDAFMNLPEIKSLNGLFDRALGGIAFGKETKAAVGQLVEEMADLEPFERLLKLLEVCHKLDEADDYKILNAQGFSLETQVQDNDRINMVFNYIKDHFLEPIALEDMAHKASMTVPSFCRYFKKVTNKTFVNFVNEYRVVHACKLLAEKQVPIAEVCYESGFNNFSHFNKSFKEFTGKSASQYRKELKAHLQ